MSALRPIHGIFSWSILLNLVLISSLCSAQQYDQSYGKWKAQQEAIDQKLKGSDPNYYLSKPALSSASNSQVSSSKSKITSGGTQAAKIRLNSANVQDLQQLNGVGEKKALAIIEYREQHGKFKTIDELQNVKGIGPKLIEKNKARLSL